MKIKRVDTHNLYRNCLWFNSNYFLVIKLKTRTYWLKCHD